VRRTKWTGKSLLGALWGYAIDVSEAFRTVSLGSRMNKPLGNTPDSSGWHHGVVPRLS
jgi:hypothetical protein